MASPYIGLRISNNEMEDAIGKPTFLSDNADRQKNYDYGDQVTGVLEGAGLYGIATLSKAVIGAGADVAAHEIREAAGIEGSVLRRSYAPQPKSGGLSMGKVLCAVVIGGVVLLVIKKARQ